MTIDIAKIVKNSEVPKKEKEKKGKEKKNPTMLLLSATRALLISKCSQPPPTLSNRTHMESRPRNLHGSTFSRSASRSPPREASREDTVCDGTVSLQEWQGWGTTSPLPAMVAEIVQDLKIMERDVDAHMSFGGLGGKLQVNNN